MKVVHLTTTCGLGGAGKAAMRLHEGLLALEIDSQVVTRKSAITHASISEVDSPLFEVADHFENCVLNAERPQGATIISATPVEVDILSHPWVQGADIVHLHWVASFLDAACLSSLHQAGKAVFWTFHDQRPYTGGCHFTAGCEKYSGSCEACPQMPEHLHPLAMHNRRTLGSAFQKFSPQVICGSQQAMNQALGSGLFNSQQIHMVPYGVNTDLFKPSTTAADCAEGKIQLLFGCHSIEEKRKGFEHLVTALRHCALSPLFHELVKSGRLELVTFGQDSDALYQDFPCPVRRLGAIHQEAVAEAYREASVYLCPTLEDAGPQVVVEALACACPVIAYPTGVVPDVITHGVNGLIVSPIDSSALAQTIVNYISQPSLRQRLREGARIEHGAISLLDAARQTLNLYEAHRRHPSLTPLSDSADQPLSSPYLLPASIKPAYAVHVLSFLELSFGRLHKSLKTEIQKKEALKRKLHETKHKLENLKANRQLKKSRSLFTRILATFKTLVFNRN